MTPIKHRIDSMFTFCNRKQLEYIHYKLYQHINSFVNPIWRSDFFNLMAIETTYLLNECVDTDD